MSTLLAPAHWQRIEFISDLHLSPAQPATLEAWLRYLGATRADALFILGDLFEVWIGDDAADEPGFEADCSAALQRAARQRPVFVMHGNRDFLIGPHWCERTGVQRLDDPTTLDAFGQRWLLSHGDALCLEDHDYQAFRAQVRSDAWQRDFLARPLIERRAIARGMRDASEARKRSSAQTTGDPLWADVDAAAAVQWLTRAGASTLIHGHTHRPRQHDLQNGLQRLVLSDWHLDEAPQGAPDAAPRAEVLVLDAQGLHREPWR